jgi:hypothetical protein
VTVENGKELDEFRRMRIAMRIDKEAGLVATYREHITHYRNRLDIYHCLLGHIAERLGEPEPKEPS